METHEDQQNVHLPLDGRVHKCGRATVKGNLTYHKQCPITVCNIKNNQVTISYQAHQSMPFNANVLCPRSLSGLAAWPGDRGVSQKCPRRVLSLSLSRSLSLPVSLAQCLSLLLWKSVLLPAPTCLNLSTILSRNHGPTSASFLFPPPQAQSSAARVSQHYWKAF